MVLRLAWVTPLGPRSDVGAFSRNILAAARRDHAARVEMLPIVQGNGPEHFVEGPRLALDDRFDPDLLAAFDHPCYNLGNNAENHGRINRLALARPGVVILHDVVMHPSLAFEAFEAGRGAGALGRRAAGAGPFAAWLAAAAHDAGGGGKRQRERSDQAPGRRNPEAAERSLAAREIPLVPAAELFDDGRISGAAAGILRRAAG